MIICRVTDNEYLQVAYLDDRGGISPETLQVKVSHRELANIEGFLNKGLKRIEKSFGLGKEAYDVEAIAEGQYCICLYHATQRAVLTIRGETMRLHFSLIPDLIEELNKLVSSSD